MKSKHAQIHMMETIAILLVFFVILVIAFMFYIRTTGFSQQQKITQVQELQSIKVSQTISFLPELQCSSKNIISDNCFDKLKLDAFRDLQHDDVFEETYYPLFYYSEIIVKETYPATDPATDEWTLYSKTRDGTSYLTSSPVLLYDPLSRTNAFGLLNVRYYTID